MATRIKGITQKCIYQHLHLKSCFYCKKILGGYEEVATFFNIVNTAKYTHNRKHVEAKILIVKNFARRFQYVIQRAYGLFRLCSKEDSSCRNQLQEKFINYVTCYQIISLILPTTRR